MHQPSSSHDFDPIGTESPSRNGGKWIALGLTFAVMFIVAAGVGFGLGRGTWVVPSSIATSIPAPLSAWLPSSPGATADLPTDLTHYAFELVSSEAKQGEAVIEVRLIDKRSGKLVPEAVIFARRLDMAPEGMASMVAKLEPQPATEPGTYRFKADLMMEGGWQLSLGAKIQGETGTVQSKLLLKAMP